MIRPWFSLVRRFGCLLGSAVLAVGVLALPVAALAQSTQPSLAEIARQEQERRKAIKTTSKVYTDKEVKQAPRPDASQAAAVAPTPVPEAEVAGVGGAKPADVGKDQAYWKARMTQAREDLRRNDMFSEALQTRVNSLTADYIARDDPFQRAKIGEDRQKALGEMERVKTEVERLKKQITDIEDDARRAGVPPGWLR